MKRLALLLLAACEQIPAPPAPVAPSPAADVVLARDYLRGLSSRLARRPLHAEELRRVEAEGPAAIAPIIDAWLASPAFVDAARDMVEHLLKSSGRLTDIDYDLPGNLAAHLVRRELPYSMLLTAGFCVDADDARIECDTSAPYAAGVLTTRAYLSANASRFNLRRATTLMNVFACKGYPMSFELQPAAEREELIPMFQAQNPEEQTVEEAQNGFGNGFGCYTCHSQFASHAQLYVKFDSAGLWRSYAHGLQDKFGELGRSTGRFFASHFSELSRAEDERGQVFGRSVANLAEAARAVVEHEHFVPCAARRSFEYAFDLDETVSSQSDPILYRRVAEALRRAGHVDPSFQQLFRAVVTDPVVIRAVTEQR